MNRVFFLGLSVIGIWLSVCVEARAVEKDVAERAEVRDVIQSQLKSLQKNDFKAAYDFAHSGIKRQFTQQQFERMVRRGFPSMLVPGDTAFGKVRQDGANVEIQMFLTDEKGRSSGFQYRLEKENGVWRITSVIPLKVGESLV